MSKDKVEKLESSDCTIPDLSNKMAAITKATSFVANIVIIHILGVGTKMVVLTSQWLC